MKIISSIYSIYKSLLNKAQNSADNRYKTRVATLPQVLSHPYIRNSKFVSLPPLMWCRYVDQVSRDVRRG